MNDKTASQKLSFTGGMNLFRFANNQKTEMSKSGLEDERRKQILKILERVPKRTPPGWQRKDFAVGGLLYAGFSEVQTKTLVCISSGKISMIDCETGEKEDCEGDYDEDDLIAYVDGLGDESIRIEGICGGALRRHSAAFQLELAAPYYPREMVLFQPRYRSCFCAPVCQNSYIDPGECAIIFENYEIRAYGFSRCGNYMVACCSSDLSIFSKVK